MLPRATSTRTARETGKGPSGRTHEIQRLIGRSLRAVTNLAALKDRTVWIDCDVLQADGGTRTAAISGAYVALVLALEWLRKRGLFETLPVTDHVAAVSVGISGGQILLDLCYEEDLHAAVDMNVVMGGAGSFIEIQGTGEEATFSRAELDGMLEAAAAGIQRIVGVQREVLAPVLRL
jgi:ribonuclease PH